jgi:hypothetical protein
MAVIVGVMLASVAFASGSPVYAGAAALPGGGDLDARLVPWAILRRRALEAGLAWGPGWNATAELGAQAARGRWWAGVTARAGEQVSGLVRWRSPIAGGSWYAEGGLSRAPWGAEGHTPTPARRWSGSLTIGGLRQGVPGPWRAHAVWSRREVLGDAVADGGDGWRVALERRF